jgi:hypothetical protein
MNVIQIGLVDMTGEIELMYVDPSKPPTIQNIGKADSSKSLHKWIDSLELEKDQRC